jgi:hypothetical protein
VIYQPFSKFHKSSQRGAHAVGRAQKPELLITANPKANEEMTQLDCSQQIGKKIYDKCQQIWNLTNPNTKGRARGGQNTPPREKGFLNRLGFTW